MHEIGPCHHYQLASFVGLVKISSLCPTALFFCAPSPWDVFSIVSTFGVNLLSIHGNVNHGRFLTLGLPLNYQSTGKLI